jgi:hypothetical protein
MKSDKKISENKKPFKIKVFKVNDNHYQIQVDKNIFINAKITNFIFSSADFNITDLGNATYLKKVFPNTAKEQKSKRILGKRIVIKEEKTNGVKESDFHIDWLGKFAKGISELDNAIKRESDIETGLKIKKIKK